MIFISDEIKWNLGKSWQCLYFYTTDMIFHNKILLLLNNIEKKYSSINFSAIDAECFKTISTRYDIKSVPTIILFSSRREVGRLVGNMNSDNIIKFYNTHKGKK